jgi:alpha-D-xyloside xylohydrolase
MRLHRLRSFLLPVIFALAVVWPASAQWIPLNPVVDAKQQPDGALITLKLGYLRLRVCTESIVRVVYSLDAAVPARPDFIVTKTNWPHVDFALQMQDPKSVVLKTSRLTVKVSRANSAMTFLDVAGKPLAQEDGRTLTPVEVNGEKTLRSERFVSLWGTEEAFYGLGQHQAGVWNYRGEAVDISQDNTNISVPFLLSSNGYGLFFNNGSRSHFNNRFAHAFYYSSEVADAMDYYFIYGPEFDKLVAAYRDLTGQVPLFGRWAYGFWQCKNKYETQEQILGIAHKYREVHIPIDNIVQDWFWWITMGNPVFDPKRYPDPKGMLDDLHKNNFHLMISVWPFFRPNADGHPESPDPVYQDMDKRGFFIAKTISPSFHPVGQGLYDAFNSEARKYYWDLIEKALFKIGVDAWWLDTTEAETEGRETNIVATSKTALGNGARYVNEYPLLTTTGVHEGQRASSNQKRVFILSRSAFAGSQRNSVATWSGDVNPNWETFQRQIPAGLNYSVSGLPYWTTDIGGFVGASPSDPAYRELFVRWFQFGTFCPIFRVHGTRFDPNENELWSYGPEAQKILTRFDRLRYRLLPYIYSVAWRVTNEGYTMMRPLVMDFRTDVRAQNVGDQFLFGPALLVNPVTEPSATTRHLYLPSTKWYDFWTGTVSEGGRTVDAPTSIDRIPLYVRAGSIIPLGPDVEYSGEEPADPIELRVYRGANGRFTLYEDENDNYNYEKGAQATIPIQWDEAQKSLTIGDRSGQFPGMLVTRTFRVVFVGENHGVDIAPSEAADKIIQYSGRQVTVVP